MSLGSFAASPGGKRVGIIAASSGRTRVLIGVVPKSFEGAPQQHVSLVSWTHEGFNRLSLAEKQRLIVHAAEASVFMENLVRRLSAKIADRRLNTSASTGTLESLLSEIPGPRSRPPESPRSSSVAEDSDERVLGLLELLTRVGFLDLDSDTIGGADASAPLLRPLLVRRFLDEVGRCLPQVRRGYRTVTEHRGVVRGRVRANSLLEMAATGVPRLRCTYDELTESTELLRIVCTALEAVADGRGRPSAFPGHYAEQVLRHDAVVYRRALGGIEPLPARTALAMAGRLRLGRLDRPWASALKLSLRILASIQAEPAHSGVDLDAAEISVETEKIWEGILTQALRTIDRGFDIRTPNDKREGSACPADARPHLWSLRPEPDNVVITDTDTLVFDAKYKRFDGRLDRDDEYQMFAYSHLIGQQDRPTTALALVYPTDRTAPPVESTSDTEPDSEVFGRDRAGSILPHWSRGGGGPRDTTAPPLLYALKLDFPQIADLKPGAWPAYIAGVAARLERFIDVRS